MSTTARPRVHVVVVDHDGGDLTLACLRSIVASAWPADRLAVVLVDNASQEPVTDAVARELPRVRVVRSATNRGFAGGVNLGLLERDEADYVAIVNNDATVEPGWLGPLAETLAGDAALGAACPKILLATPAVEMTLQASTHRRRGDHRDLGVRVGGARVGGADVWGRTQLVDGLWGYEPMPAGETGAQWTSGAATLRVPAGGGGGGGSGGGPIELRLATDAPMSVELRSGTRATTVTVGTTPSWYEVASDAEPVEVVNNVGTEIGADGYGRDRGWLEVDRGQLDEPVDVDAWCGAAVLLSRAYLDDVGPLDERLFLYYEDVEHSLRGARRGWRYRTAPTAIARHVHSATSIEGSPLSSHYNERNRLLVLGATASPADSARAYARYLAITASYARRDLVGPALRGDRPRPEIVGRRLRALGAAAVRLPAMRRRPPTAQDPRAPASSR